MKPRRSIIIDTAATPSPLPATAAAPQPRSQLTHMTVVAFVKLHGLKVPPGELSGHGRNLSQLSRQRKIEIQKVEDARWGIVHAYNVNLLREYFEVQ